VQACWTFDVIISKRIHESRVVPTARLMQDIDAKGIIVYLQVCIDRFFRQGRNSVSEPNSQDVHWLVYCTGSRSKSQYLLEAERKRSRTWLQDGYLMPRCISLISRNASDPTRTIHHRQSSSSTLVVMCLWLCALPLPGQLAVCSPSRRRRTLRPMQQ